MGFLYYKNHDGAKLNCGDLLQLKCGNHSDLCMSIY